MSVHLSCRVAASNVGFELRLLKGHRILGSISKSNLCRRRDYGRGQLYWRISTIECSVHSLKCVSLTNHHRRWCQVLRDCAVLAKSHEIARIATEEHSYPAKNPSMQSDPCPPSLSNYPPNETTEPLVRDALAPMSRLQRLRRRGESCKYSCSI